MVLVPGTGLTHNKDPLQAQPIACNKISKCQIRSDLKKCYGQNLIGPVSGMTLAHTKSKKWSPLTKIVTSSTPTTGILVLAAMAYSRATWNQEFERGGGGGRFRGRLYRILVEGGGGGGGGGGIAHPLHPLSPLNPALYSSALVKPS